jgi:hypothetical protein
MSKSPNLLLKNRDVLFRGEKVGDYEGEATLRKWIEKAEKNHAGAEKTIVDEFVEKNSDVIDLEMALPAWHLRNAADRMDLVAIEDGKVVFWEVKTVNDGRIRCKADFRKDESPHVLRQLANYRAFLAEERHVEQIKSAYLETARLLVELRKLADKIGPAQALGASIIAANKDQKLSVADRAALVVVDLPKDNKRAWKSWKASHEGKLSGEIPMRVLESAGPLVFAGAQLVAGAK